MARFVVAVTGGIASGKSLVDRAFASLGVVVVDADQVAREIVAPGMPALTEIAAAFGAGVIRADGTLDRAAMRQRVFSDPTDRRRLEAITHPRIRDILLYRCQGAPGPYVVASIPLLAESGAMEAYHWLDRVLVVDAPVFLQHSRLVERDGIGAELAESIIASQVGRKARLSIVTDAVINDAGPEGIPGIVARLDALYRKIAAA